MVKLSTERRLQRRSQQASGHQPPFTSERRGSLKKEERFRYGHAKRVKGAQGMVFAPDHFEVWSDRTFEYDGVAPGVTCEGDAGGAALLWGFLERNVVEQRPDLFREVGGRQWPGVWTRGLHASNIHRCGI
ncbi:hypothetical protein GCM10008960_42470 [Deinococcus sedimenti]|uniref:Uncharacterized protein n=1 Tax=Deinococcus sedimenti TaxID=1867090 RepID=A0ABQ2SBR5_9DEIO|nr:hypothetical protein GCM10008960_42470 [Deinococcus sedimenti]